MKTLILSILLAASMTASAQRVFPMTPEEDTEVGQLLEKSAQQRGHAMIVMAGCALASGVMFAIGDDTGRVVGPIVLGAGTIFTVGLSIGSINKQARAGRILQGKPK